MTTPTPPAQAAASNYVSGSLYVGDLPKGATEGQLFDVFRNVGPVASIRVCRDAVTKESLGYAYVNFHNNADAERAIEQLNFTPILGKPCRIMWSQRDPAKRKSGTGNIFIKNLDKSINNAALYDTFSAFGHILSCKVEVDDNGVSKGYGFVHYETQDEADKAVARVNGMLVAGKIVFVGPFLPKKARGTDAPPAVFTNVYVKNLDESVNQEKLQEMFEKHGKVTSCAVMQNEKGESKGFGFVNFEKAEEAQAAVDALNNTVINGKQMYAGRAQKKQERAEELRQKRSEQVQKFQGANVYVKNLDDNVNDEKLKQEFSRFGAITSAKVMTDDKGNSKGFGFILFSNSEDATRAITEMNGVIFGTKPLYASLAQRKDVRQAQLAVLHQQKVNMMQMNLMNNMRGPGMMFPGPQFGYPPMGGMPPRMPFPPQMMQRGGQPRFGPGGPQGAGPQPNGAPQGNGVPQGGRGGPGGFQAGGDVGQRGGNNRPRNPRPPPAQPANGKGRGQGGQNQNAQGQLNKNYKYTSTARNQPAAGNAPANPPPQEPENENEAKQQAGEQLYTLIFGKAHPMLAGKITGMLLESHNIGELHEIIRTASLLDSKVAEALAVLQAHQPEGEAAAPISV